MPNLPKKRRTTAAAASQAGGATAASTETTAALAAAPAKRASSLHSALQASTTLLLDALDDVESASRPELPPLLAATSSHLLSVRRAQRQLCLSVERDLQSSVSARRRETESQGLALQNLMYERDYLRGRIRGCREFECRELTKMARDEVGASDEEDGGEGGAEEGEVDGGGESGSGSGAEEEGKKETVVKSDAEKAAGAKKDGDDGGDDADDEGDQSDRNDANEAAVDAFLGRKKSDDDAPASEKDGDTEMKESETDANTTAATDDAIADYSHRDPSNHTRNLSRLQSELAARSSLVKSLQSSRSELTSAKRRLDDARSFLDNLPRKLGELERSSMPLQNFFLRAGRQRAKALASASGRDPKTAAAPNKKKAPLLTGTERAERLDAAMELSGPLYGLFVQLQSFVDASMDDDADDDVGLLKLEVHRSKKASKASSKGVGPAAAARFSAASSTATSDDDSDAGGIGDGSVFDLGKALASDGSSVSLGLPIPDCPGLPSAAASVAPPPNGAFLTVTFRYLPVLNVVTAEASGGDGKIEDAEGVLRELFPGDDGLALPNDAAAALRVAGERTRRRDDNGDDAEDEVEDDAAEGDAAGRVVKNDVEETAVTPAAAACTPSIDQIHAALADRVDKPYRWAQFLAGLHFPPSPTSSSASGRENRTEPCTNAAIRQLARRVRARTVLSGIVAALDRAGRRSGGGGGAFKDLPVNPAFLKVLKEEGGGEDHDDVTAKVAGWAEAKGEPFASAASSDDARYYSLTLKRGSSGLTATVRLGAAYPAEPPLWSLQPATASLLLDGGDDTTSWGERHGSVGSLHPNRVAPATDEDGKAASGGAVAAQPPLYDPSLGSIESSVNGLDAASRLVIEGNEETYDWLLAHQLREAVRLWDASERCSEEEAKASAGGKGGARGGKGSGGSSALGGRKRRGRDRTPAAWGGEGNHGGCGFGAYSAGL